MAFLSWYAGALDGESDWQSAEGGAYYGSADDDDGDDYYEEYENPDDVGGFAEEAYYGQLEDDQYGAAHSDMLAEVDGDDPEYFEALNEDHKAYFA